MGVKTAIRALGEIRCSARKRDNPPRVMSTPNTAEAPSGPSATLAAAFERKAEAADSGFTPTVKTSLQFDSVLAAVSDLQPLPAQMSPLQGAGLCDQGRLESGDEVIKSASPTGEFTHALEQPPQLSVASGLVDGEFKADPVGAQFQFQVAPTKDGGGLHQSEQVEASVGHLVLAHLFQSDRKVDGELSRGDLLANTLFLLEKLFQGELHADVKRPAE